MWANLVIVTLEGGLSLQIPTNFTKIRFSQSLSFAPLVSKSRALSLSPDEPFNDDVVRLLSSDATRVRHGGT